MFERFAGGTLRRYLRKDRGSKILRIEKLENDWIAIHTENGSGIGFNTYNIDVIEDTEDKFVFHIIGERTKWLLLSAKLVENQKQFAGPEQSAHTPER